MTWRTLLAIDADKWAAETYRANFPDSRVECGPVAGFIPALPDCDVIIGGPPCQPFSDAGENEGESDARDCIPDFVAAIAAKRPRQFLMENVRGLLKARHWSYFCRVIDQLESLGYRVEWRLLDAVAFGVPQFRERVWVWGIRSDIAARHCWPRPTHSWPPPDQCMFGAALLAGVTVGQALNIDGWYDAQNEIEHGPDEPCGTIQGNAQSKGGDAGHYAVRRIRGSGVIRRDHPISEPCPTVMQPTGGKSGLMLVRVIGGGRHDVLPKTIRDITCEPSTTIMGQWQDHQQPRVELYHWSDAMLEKHPPASPAPTVQAKWAKGGAEGLLAVTKWRQKGDLWIRRLAPLECLRLQSGPDDFRWPDGIKKTHAYRIVGNGWASHMGAVFSESLHAADPQSETIVDLFCGGGLGAVGWHGKFWSYQSEVEVAA